MPSICDGTVHYCALDEMLLHTYRAHSHKTMQSWLSKLLSSLTWVYKIYVSKIDYGTAEPHRDCLEGLTLTL